MPPHPFTITVGGTGAAGVCGPVPFTVPLVLPLVLLVVLDPNKGGGEEGGGGLRIGDGGGDATIGLHD